MPSRTGSSVYAQLVRLFEASLQKGLDELRSALQSNNLQAAAATAHRLKASAANVGASGLASAVRLLEQQCQSGDARRAQQLLEQFVAAQPGILEQLASLTLEKSA